MTVALTKQQGICPIPSPQSHTLQGGGAGGGACPTNNSAPEAALHAHFKLEIRKNFLAVGTAKS